MTVTITPEAVRTPDVRSDEARVDRTGWRTTLSDSLVFARRNLEHIRQIPRSCSTSPRSR